MVAMLVSKLYSELKKKKLISEVTANLNADDVVMDHPDQSGLFLMATSIYGEDYEKMFTIYANYYEEKKKEGDNTFGYAIIDVVMARQCYAPNALIDALTTLKTVSDEIIKMGLDAFSSEMEINKIGFSPVVFSIGDVNTLTAEGNVQGFNLYTRMSHIATGYMATVAVDEEILGLDPTIPVNERSVVIHGSNRFDEENLKMFASLGLGNNATGSSVKRFVETVRSDIHNCSLQLVNRVLMPIAQAAVSSNFFIKIGGK